MPVAAPATTRAALHARIQREEHRLLPDRRPALGGGSAVVPRSAREWDVPSNSYDLVVLGDDLAALVCATLCARRGLRTLVLGDDRPARYTLGPHKLPIEPALWPIGAGSAGERVLKELHAELALRRKLREPQDRRAAGRARPAHRSRRRSPRAPSSRARSARDADATGSRAGNAAPRSRGCSIRCSPASTRSPASASSRSARSRKLAEHAAEAAAAWWTDAERDPHAALWRQLAAIALRHPAPPPAAIARALDAWRTGPPALRGDGDAIRELLVEKLTTAGGEVRAGTVTELDVSWGKIVEPHARERRRDRRRPGRREPPAAASSPSCSARRRRSG